MITPPHGSRPHPLALPLIIALGILLAPPTATSQFRRGAVLPDQGADPRALAQTTMDFPTWEIDDDLPEDLFTFARLNYPSGNHPYPMEYGRPKWYTDYPDADLNISFRLQQLTSLLVNPNPVVVDIDAEKLRHFPFVYLVECGTMNLSDEQGKIMREWMLNGGFLMIDDFWGDREWDGFMRGGYNKIWPDRKWEELTLEHEIFHCVFDLKERPQVPSIAIAMQSRGRITWEERKPGSRHVHYRAVKDDNGRICMLICYNTDLGDGWEREGDNHWFFKEFAEKRSFPMGINIIFYALTH